MDDQAEILAERDGLLADIDLIKESVSFMTEQSEIDIELERLGEKKLKARELFTNAQEKEQLYDETKQQFSEEVVGWTETDNKAAQK